MSKMQCKDCRFSYKAQGINMCFKKDDKIDLIFENDKFEDCEDFEENY